MSFEPPAIFYTNPSLQPFDCDFAINRLGLTDPYYLPIPIANNIQNIYLQVHVEHVTTLKNPLDTPCVKITKSLNRFCEIISEITVPIWMMAAVHRLFS